MGAAYLAIYTGHPQDESEFDGYYHSHHIPILRRLPKIRSVEVLKGVPGREQSVYQIVEMRFDSLDDLESALRSAVREEAAADRRKVLEHAFDGHIQNQTVVVEDCTYPSGAHSDMKPPCAEVKSGAEDY